MINRNVVVVRENYQEEAVPRVMNDGNVEEEAMLESYGDIYLLCGGEPVGGEWEMTIVQL